MGCPTELQCLLFGNQASTPSLPVMDRSAILNIRGIYNSLVSGRVDGVMWCVFWFVIGYVTVLLAMWCAMRVCVAVGYVILLRAAGLVQQQ